MTRNSKHVQDTPIQQLLPHKPGPMAIMLVPFDNVRFFNLSYIQICRVTIYGTVMNNRDIFGVLSVPNDVGAVFSLH